MLLFIVPRFADIDFFVLGKTARSALVVTRYEHDKASVDDFFNAMISILACLDNFVLKKVLFKPMNSLFGAVVPAGVDAIFPGFVNVSAIYLRNNGFGQVVGVGDVHPIAYASMVSTTLQSHNLGYHATYRLSRPLLCGESR